MACGRPAVPTSGGDTGAVCAGALCAAAAAPINGVAAKVVAALVRNPRRVTPPSLSLFDAIETSLVQNPDLTALRQNEGVSLGLLGVARTYPFNPFVQLQATPFQQAPEG